MKEYYIKGREAMSLFRSQDNGKIGGFISEEGKNEFIDVYELAMKDLPKPTEEFGVDTEFGKAKVYKFSEEGTASKTPLLLLPGKSASTPMWEPNLKDMMKERSIYTVEIIGEPGLSVQTKEINTAENQAVWLNKVIEQFPEETIHLAGLSFGGWNAVNVTVYNSMKIKSLILIDPLSVFGPIPLKIITDPLKKILVAIPASMPIIPRSIREKMFRYISGGAETDENVPTARLIETGIRTYRSVLPMPEDITEKQLQEIKIPVLGIIAENSTMNNAERAMDVGLKNLRNPLSNMIMFQNASHAITGEYPEKLSRSILNFIQEVDTNIDN